MHSSRMRTARFSGHLLGGMQPPLYAGIHTPTVNRMTDGCKNITFPQFRLRAVKMPDLSTLRNYGTQQ